jgi:hypothetical protein
MNKVCLSNILIVLFSLCSCSFKPEGQGACGSIAVSKERQVFIEEYFVSPNPYIINDSLRILVKEAWIENWWAYSGDELHPIIIPGYYQLCIKTEEADISNIDFTWRIGLDADFYLRSSGKSSLIGDFKQIPTGDSLVYPVEKGNNFMDSGEHQIIGKFVLYRKK